MECLKVTKIISFYFFLPILFQNAFFGIHSLDLDTEYCRLLLTPALEHSFRSALSAKILANIIYEGIETDLLYIELKFGHIGHRMATAGITFNKRTPREAFEKLKAKIEKKITNERIGMVDVCYLWSLDVQLNKLTNFLSKDGPFQLEKELNKLVNLLNIDKNGSRCTELASIDEVFEARPDQIPLWVIDFREFVSKKHFTRLDELLFEAEKAQQSNFSVWVNAMERVQGESQLSHMLRMMNGRGETENIVWLKSAMNRYLMEYQYIGMLELHNPLTMAFEIVGDSMLKTTYRGIVMFEGDKVSGEMAQQNKNWLLLSLLCGKITDFFEHQVGMHRVKIGQQEEEEESAKMAKLGELWKLFALHLARFKRTSEFANNAQLVIKLDGLLEYLRGQFGAQQMSLKQQILVQRHEHIFLELYGENPAFRHYLQKNISLAMVLLKEIWEVAEENETIISSPFWTFLTSFLNDEEESFVNPSETKNESESVVEPHPLKCPDKDVPLGKLREMDVEKAEGDEKPMLMISMYKDVISNKDESATSLDAKIDIEAMILGYKMNILLFIEVGQNLEQKKIKFMTEMANYKREWEGLTTKTFASSEQELCQLHKLANSMAKNGILLKESKKWREFLAKTVGEATENPTDRKLVLLPDENNFRWNDSNCADESVQNKVVILLLKKQNALAQFHFVALDSLLKGFGELRHFFCYGTDQLDFIDLKEHTRFIFGSEVLNALELNHPEIMHFEMTVFSHRLLLLLEQLSHQTDSAEAEKAEARIYASVLVKELQLHGRTTAKENAVDKLIRFFYRLLVDTQTAEEELKGTKWHTNRNLLCVLSHFVDCVRNERQIKVRSILTNCEREESVKGALIEQRARQREITILFVEKCLANAELNVVQRLKLIKGGRARLWKMLYKEDQTVEQNERELKNLWEGFEQRDDGQLFTGDYEDTDNLILHYKEALLDKDNDLGRTKGKMKAEIFIFVRWIDAQFALFSPELVQSVQIYWQLFVRMMDAFYDQMFDGQRADEVQQNEQELIDLIVETKVQVEKLIEHLSSEREERITGQTNDATKGQTNDKTEGQTNDATKGKTNDKTEGQTDDATKGQANDETKGQANETKEGQQQELVGTVPWGIKSEDEMRKEWRRRHFIRVKRSKKAQQQFVKAKLRSEYVPWMSELQGNSLIRMINMDKEFARELKNEFENSMIKKYFLIELLEVEKAKEVLNELGLADSRIFETLDIIDTYLVKGNSVKKGKNKTKKRKNVKRGAKGGKQIGEEEEVAKKKGKQLREEEGKNEEEEEEEGEGAGEGQSGQGQTDDGRAKESDEGTAIDQLDEHLQTEEPFDDGRVKESDEGTAIDKPLKREEPSDENLGREMPTLEQESVQSPDDRIINAKNKPASTERSDDGQSVGGLSTEKLDPNEFVGIKLVDFENDQFLTLKYGEFMGLIISMDKREGPRREGFPELHRYGAMEDWENEQKGCATIAHSLVHLLDIGILANEIWHYIQTMKALSGKRGEGKGKSLAKIDQEWDQLKQAKLEQEIIEKGNNKLMEQKLFDLLKRIVTEEFVSKNEQILDLDATNAEYCQVRHQLHLRKFGMALFNSGAFWTFLDQRRRKAVVSKLFKEENEGKINYLIEKLEKYLVLIGKMNGQMQIDENLFNDYKNQLKEFVGEKVRKSFIDAEKWAMPDEFAKNWQEINFQKNSTTKDDQINQIKVHLTKNGYLFEENPLKSQQIISALTAIVKAWCPAAIVKFPLLIKLGNEMAQQKPLCLLPDKCSGSTESIFGTLNCEGGECADSSLYCAICMHPAVKLLKKIGSTNNDGTNSSNNVQYLWAVPKLEFHFVGVPIEMAFVWMQSVELSTLTAEKGHFGLEEYEKVTNYFAKNIENLLNFDNYDEGMNQEESKMLALRIKELGKANPSVENKFQLSILLEEKKKLTIAKEKALKQRKILNEQKGALMALSSNWTEERILQILSPIDTKLDKKSHNYYYYYSYEKILNENGREEKLQVVLAYLEMWAKKNYIYERAMGFLDKRMLLIMLVKVLLLFPEASVPFLIEKFFLVYSKWKWPIPVQLTRIDQGRSAEFLSWMPGHEWLTKKQFKPKNHRQQIDEVLAMPIISPTFPERNEACRINASTAKVIQNELKLAFVHLRTMADESRPLIEPILNDIKFSEKYEHFATFTCGGYEFHIERFCHFVGKRLSEELFQFVEKPMANSVAFCHVYPKLLRFVDQQQPTDDEQKKEKGRQMLQQRMWVVGLKLQKAKKKSEDDSLGRELATILGGKFAEIDAKIKNDFERNEFYNVQLKSECAERSNIEKIIASSTEAAADLLW